MGSKSSKTVLTHYECYISTDKFTYEALKINEKVPSYNQTFTHFKIKHKRIKRFNIFGIKVKLYEKNEYLDINNIFYDKNIGYKINHLGNEMIEYRVKLSNIKLTQVVLRFHNNILTQLILQTG